MATAEDRGQLLRLDRFRHRHPHILIAEADFGAWEARIPQRNGEHVKVSPREEGGLRGLLDDLEDLLDTG